jgi:hypothetical protein
VFGYLAARLIEIPTLRVRDRTFPRPAPSIDTSTRAR